MIILLLSVKKIFNVAIKYYSTLIIFLFIKTNKYLKSIEKSKMHSCEKQITACSRATPMSTPSRLQQLNPVRTDFRGPPRATTIITTTTFTTTRHTTPHNITPYLTTHPCLILRSPHTPHRHPSPVQVLRTHNSL